MRLTDDVVLLRAWISADASFLADASNDPAVEHYNGPMPDSAASALEVICSFDRGWRSFEAEKDPTGTAFAIVDVLSGEPVGMCGIDGWSSTDGAQFGYWLVGAARGRGLATRAVMLMTGWLFELGAARVFLTIKPENSASAAVARRAGFVHEGKPRADGVRRKEEVDVFEALPDEWRARSR